MNLQNVTVNLILTLCHICWLIVHFVVIIIFFVLI